jgi:transcriptional regulator with GAF, ATPase, and Fis domain
VSNTDRGAGDYTTTSSISRADGPTLSAVDLIVLDGPDRGLRQRLGPGVIRVGAGPAADIRLTDPTVSRVHCTLELKPGGIRIVDLGSTNGVVVHGVRVEAGVLTGGSTITIGSTTMRVDVTGDGVRVEVSPVDCFGDVLGGSVEMRRLYAVLDRIAPTDTTMLIQGETGTGKDAVARAVHAASRRSSKPFVAIDCGAIAETLIESELFGHVRGAFSGAVQERRGLFEEASGGTLFLDEIGELPLALQPKLLRALETREVRPVGGNASRRVDVRVLAATNRPLASAVNAGTFREDLYYRLAVVEVALPPLRERREDIPMLAQSFHEQLAGPGQPGLPPNVVASLTARAWPGNVRELRNYIERSISLGWAESSAARPTHERPAVAAPPALDALVSTELPLKEARARWTTQFELLYATALLRKTGGNVTRAAELAGVARRSFQRLMAGAAMRSEDDDLDPDEPEPV